MTGSWFPNITPTKNSRKRRRGRKGGGRKQGGREEQLSGETAASRSTPENVQDVPGTSFGLIKKIDTFCVRKKTSKGLRTAFKMNEQIYRYFRENISKIWCWTVKSKLLDANYSAAILTCVYNIQMCVYGAGMAQRLLLLPYIPVL